MGVQAAARKARQAERARERAEQDRLPPWTPFQRAYPHMSPKRRDIHIREIMRMSAERGQPVTYEAVERLVNEKLTEEMYQNSRYTVLVFRDEEQEPDTPKMIHLSIRRNDRARPREERYRDFQRIKSEIIGPEYEAVELYPAEDRVADCANQYHLYVLADPELQFGFGFREGMRDYTSVGGAIQAPLEE